MLAEVDADWALQDKHTQPGQMDFLGGRSDTSTILLYEQPGAPFDFYRSDFKSRGLSKLNLKQRITESAMASAVAAIPHDDFDDDEFLSNPADIPVDPNSEVVRRETSNRPSCRIQRSSPI